MRCDRLRVCRFVLVEARTFSYITLWLTLQIEDTRTACVLPRGARLLPSVSRF